MSRGLRDIKSTLPPGFRFCPSDEELVFHYLYKKVTNIISDKATEATLMVVNLHSCEPSELPDAAKLNENEWYFFSFRERKYSTGFRTNRAAKKGYWKATGKDRTVQEPSRRRPLVGVRKTLVFYNGRAPDGVKSGWVMHEFRLENPFHPPKEDWVLCRVFQRTKCTGHGETARLFGVVQSEQTNNTYAIAAGPSSYLNMAPSTSSSSFPLRRIEEDDYGQQLATNSDQLLDAVYHHGRRPDAACSGAVSGLENLAILWQYGLPYLTDQEAEDSPTVVVDDGGEAYKLFLDMGEPQEHDLGGHEQLGGFE